MIKDEMNQGDMNDDAEFEAFLKGEGPLARALQEFDQPGPSARLDAAILADARAALAPLAQAGAVTSGLTRSANDAATARSTSGAGDAPLLERAVNRMAGPDGVAAVGGATVLPLPREARAAAPVPDAPLAGVPAGISMPAAEVSDATAASSVPSRQNEPAAALARDSAVLDSARAALARARALQAANDAAPSTTTGAARKHPMSLDWRWRVPAGIAATLLVGLVARESFESDKNGIGSDAGITAERVVQEVARAPAAGARPPPPPPAPAAEAIAPPPALATPAPPPSTPAAEVPAQAKRASAGGNVRTAIPTAASDLRSAPSTRSTAPQAAPVRREDTSARLDDVLIGEPASAAAPPSAPAVAPAPVAAADQAPRKPASAPPMPAPAAPSSVSAVPAPAPAAATVPDRPATARDVANVQPVTIGARRNRIDTSESVTPMGNTESNASNAAVATRSAPARKKPAVYGVVPGYENAKSTTQGTAAPSENDYPSPRLEYSKVEPKQFATAESSVAQAQTATAPEMLESIELLLEAGQYSAARTVWEALRTRYPAYPIPDITREKLQRRR